MLYEELARFSELSGEDGKYTSITRIGGYLDGYDKGREDERRDWKLAAGELIMKYAGDIYDALPEAVKEIYEQGRKDGITEANLNHNIECGDCVRQIFDKAYEMLGNELVWVLHEYGDDVYMNIANSITTVFQQLCGGEQDDE